MLIAFALSNLDMTLLMLPTIGLMALAMFGADERLAVSRRRPRPRHRGFCELRPDGRILVLDPDGKEWVIDSKLPASSTLAIPSRGSESIGRRKSRENGC